MNITEKLDEAISPKKPWEVTLKFKSSIIDRKELAKRMEYLLKMFTDLKITVKEGK